MGEPGRISQVVSELEKLGYSTEEATHLAVNKHRAHADLVKTGKHDPGKLAEEIMDRETGASIGVASAAGESAEAAAANPPSVVGKSSVLDSFERSIPDDE